MSERGRREPGREDPWRTRRVMRLYASGETIPLIARSVGWSEGRVRKVLREAGVVLTEEGTASKRRGSEEARRRLLGAGWEARMRGGLVVWRRPGGRGSWYPQELAFEILEEAESPGFQELTEALERALEEDRRFIRDFPADEVARRLVLGGYPREKLTLPRTADAPPASLGAEEQAFGHDVPTEDA